MQQQNLALVVFALVLLAIPAPALAQAPPGPTLVYQTRMTVTSAPAAFDLAHLVLDFAPGSATPLHTHGGQGIVTVLAGEVTHRPEGGEERVVRAGESFEELPGRPHIAANTTDAPARVIFAVLLPPGASLTTGVGDVSEQAAPQPQLVSRTGLTASDPPAQFDVVNLVLDFAPGAWTPLHSHGGQGLVTVVEGEVTHRLEGGEERVVRAGESFEELPGRRHNAGNASGAPARVVFTIMLPPGAEVTTVSDTTPGAGAPATLPNTGAEPAANLSGWLTIGAAALALVGCWLRSRTGAKRQT